MANILDIFRTNTGEKLLEKSREITNLELEKLKKAFVFAFPVLLTVYMSKDDSDTKKPKDLIAFIENENLTDFGKQETESLLTDTEQEIILDFSQILNIERDSFKNILYISTAILATTISEMKEKGNDFSGVIKTLSGLETEYNEDFVKVLIKNPDDPNLIDSSENIALGKRKDGDDQSILGGYAGGR